MQTITAFNVGRHCMLSPVFLPSEKVCVTIKYELHLTTSELWFGQEQEGILP